MKLSISKLLNIAEKSNFSSILGHLLQPRCNAQLELLNLLATKSRGGHEKARRNINDITSLELLYRDTLDFALQMGQEQELGKQDCGSRGPRTPARIKKYILNKFEFLDARHSTAIESFADIIKLTRDNNRDEELISNFLQIQTSVTLLLQHGFLLSSNKFYQQTGCVQRNCNLVTMCEGVVEHAINLAEHNTDGITRCPLINVYLDWGGRQSEVDEKIWTIDCISSSVRFVLLELLKNAISSTLFSYHDSKNSLSPIDVTLRSTNTHIIVSVQDHGMGLKGRTLDDLSKFVYNRNTEETQSIQLSYQPQSASLSGMGAGLSVSIAWAIKFGGKLELFEGKGFNLGADVDKFEYTGVTAKFSIPRDTCIEETLLLKDL